MHSLFIVDAVHYLFRSYYAIAPMTNSKGESTNAVFGFIRSIKKLIKDFSVDYLIAVFDGPDNKKSRQSFYSEYKMNRKKAPDDLYCQFETAFRFLELSAIPAISKEGVEADDTIASIVKWGKKHFDKIFICSNDKDLFQLVEDNIYAVNTYKENLEINAKKVKEIFGVNPKQIVDFLALMGDASDNIPGIEGFGPKTSAELLTQYESLDGIYKNLETIIGKKKELLVSQKEKAYLSQKLARLDDTVSIPQKIDAYKIGKEDLAGLRLFYQEMNFLSLLKELPQDLEKKEEVKKKEKINYTLVNDEKSLEDLFEKLKQEKELSIDVETDSLNPLKASLVGVGFCAQAGIAYYVPLNGNIAKAKVEHFLKKLLSSSINFFGHNIKYDYLVLQNHKLELTNISFDTLLASYLLDPQKRRHNLDILTLENFGKVKIPIEELIGKKGHSSMADVPLEKISDYCCEDVDYTFRLKELFFDKLKKEKLYDLFQKIEIPLIKILAAMERAGIYVDQEKLKEISKEMGKELNILEKKIFEEIGVKFNLNSPKQLSEILYDHLKLPRAHGSKTSEFATGADILEKLQDSSPIVKDILKYRSLQKLYTTYSEALQNAIDPETKRIHCTFNQSITATGRLSSQDPNLQNIPIRSEEGLKIRSAFKPEKRGWSFLSSDYSQIELRLLAHFSQDPALVAAFNKGQDIHKATAASVFNVPLEEVVPQMRQAAKAVNFGIIYGQGPFGLAKQLNISNRKAQEFIKSYFEKYGEIENYLKAQKKFAKENGYAITMFGRKRPLVEINSKNPTLKATAERLAINTPLQGSAADIIKLAMIEIDQVLKKERLNSFLILQIHDELIYEVPDEEVEKLKKIVQHHMEDIVEISVPLIVDIEVGKNWAQC